MCHTHHLTFPPTSLTFFFVLAGYCSCPRRLPAFGHQDSKNDSDRLDLPRPEGATNQCGLLNPSDLPFATWECRGGQINRIWWSFNDFQGKCMSNEEWGSGYGTFIKMCSNWFNYFYVKQLKHVYKFICYNIYLLQCKCYWPLYLTISV